MERIAKKFAEDIKTCLQEEPAFCTADCPFKLNVRDFILKLRRGAFNAAYRTYLNAVAFPAIVSELCHEPCQNNCPRKSKDQAIALKLLEQSTTKFAKNLEPYSYNIPPKNKSIAIIGAGISGLGCALRMASKKYDVTVFEKSDRIGGHLWDLLSPDIFLAEFERQFKYEKYTLHLNTEISDLDTLNYDSIYVATGSKGSDFGLEKSPNGAFASTKPGVFLGGELCGRNVIEALADGLSVVNALERYIKVDRMDQPWDDSGTKIQINPDFIIPSKQILPIEGQLFTEDEAKKEAERCLLCACDACNRHCDLMRYYGKFPKRIGEEVQITVRPGTLDGDGTIATRLISTCNHCGLCKEVCPQGIDTGEMLLQSHRAMREKGSMPWVFHDYWLRDMEFTNSEAAAIFKVPKGYTKSNYAFFPGCQLGASDPRYVTESYKALLEKYPDTALMLGCCGAPAEWAGEGPAHQEVIEKLKVHWISLGKPKLVMACATCAQMFEKYLPEIEFVFLYELLSQMNINPMKDGKGETVSVFDPCASRHEPDLQNEIRKLAEKAGFQLQPLYYEGKYARCCSWGGQVSIANPSYSNEVVKVRIAQNDKPYIAYCANCRDIFAKAGKPCYHILDVLFDLNDIHRDPPTITKRRDNRIALKDMLLKDYWNEETEKKQMENKIKLDIPPELKIKLNNEMILEADIQKVVEHCETSGNKIVNTDSNTYVGHKLIGRMTYWIEYRDKEDHFELVNAYSHRMNIEGEL